MINRTIVTTAGRPDEGMVACAEQTALDLDIPYVPRRKRSVSSFFPAYDAVLVRSKEKIQLYHQHSPEPFFFHPNLAMVRIKRIMAGEQDPFIEAAQLKQGDSILDCTLGFASDSIVSSYVVGESGRVIGLESSKCIAYITGFGLKRWNDSPEAVSNAMKRIEVVHQTYYEYLRDLPENAVDVVYFDPMFDSSIEESNSIQAMAPFACKEGLPQQSIEEAKRVARKRVILKDHFRSTRFLELGFTQQVRKTSKFHYGIIDLQNSSHK
ncbi:class I SAM-dependent methyltransferase [Bacillus sp. 1P06AnD]|uniref:class I SAM-dependent methyltransferase n=1 Tax=Bacillus sp. 1P06AnD TaxID=3132208 RepID=UPI00399F3035